MFITALFWVIKQRVVAIPFRRFGTTYRSHLRMSRTLDSWPWKTEVRNVGINYHYSLRNRPEERSCHLLRDGSLKSRLYTFTAQMDESNSINSISRNYNKYTSGTTKDIRRKPVTIHLPHVSLPLTLRHLMTSALKAALGHRGT